MSFVGRGGIRTSENLITDYEGCIGKLKISTCLWAGCTLPYLKMFWFSRVYEVTRSALGRLPFAKIYRVMHVQMNATC